MPLAERYYLTEDGRTAGPFSLVVLRQKADIRALRPEDLAHPADREDAAWRPIRDDAELSALLFPPRPTLGLGATAGFESVNTGQDRDAPATDVLELLRENRQHEARAEAENDPLARDRPDRRGRGRRRDFLVVTAGGNLFALGNFALGGFGSVHGVFVLSFMIVLTLGAYWVLYHVLDPY